MSFPPSVRWRISRQILTNLFSYYRLNEARNTYFCRPTLVVISNELTPDFRDRNVAIVNMFERVAQYALKISNPWRYIEPPIAGEAIHSTCVSGFLALSRRALLAIVAAGITLTAFVCPLDSAILLDVSRPESNRIVGLISDYTPSRNQPYVNRKPVASHTRLRINFKISSSPPTIPCVDTHVRQSISGSRASSRSNSVKFSIEMGWGVAGLSEELIPSSSRFRFLFWRLCRSFSAQGRHRVVGSSFLPYLLSFKCSLNWSFGFLPLQSWQ